MSDPRQFDDLARRKLEERQFAFDEAAWTDMQHILAKDRDRGGAWKWWTLAGVALLLLGFALWWNATNEAPTGHARTVEVASPDATGTSEGVQAIPSVTPEVKADPAPAQAPVPPEGAEKIVQLRSVAPPASAEPPPQETAPRHDEGRSTEPRTTEAGIAPPREVEEAVVIVPAKAVDEQPVDEQPANEAIDATNDVTADQDAGRDRVSPESKVDPVVPVIVGSAIVAHEAGDPGTTGTKNADVDPVIEGEVDTTSPTPEEIDPASAAVVVSTPADSAATTTNNEVPGPVAPTPPPPVLVPTQAPWEISALGGMLLGSSNYSGANSDTWKNDVSSLWAPSFGGELMHMGRNFGLGVGLHYTTYAEQLHMAQQSVTETFTLDSNYFQPTPMMLLIVTDVVVIDGVTYYVTETLDTTINVLVRSTMTGTRDRIVVAARDQVNRVSYFEIPILFDGRLVQGPWSFGIRGGPMIGFLSGRRGAVPNAAMDGYTEFSDQRFTEVVFGYTARAYVRYRFTDAWSVGVEPAIKGQLVNGLAEGDLSRRTTAWGGMLSLSYRLR